MAARIHPARRIIPVLSGSQALLAAGRRLLSVAFDPYAVLSVGRDAGTDELRYAYERELATAARLGALQRAQEVDRAWTLLRDPGRRRLYDRHGTATAVSRQHPLERYAPPRAVPFRAWSPDPESPCERSPSSTCMPAASSRLGRAWIVLLLLAAVLSLLSWLEFGVDGLTARSTGRPSDQTGTPVSRIEVLCPAGPAGPASTFVSPAGGAVSCPDGSPPSWRPAP